MHPNHSLPLVQHRHHDLRAAAPAHRAPRSGRLRTTWFAAVRRVVADRATADGSRRTPPVAVAGRSPLHPGASSC